MQKLAIAVSNNVSFQNFPKDRVVVKLSEAEMTETSVVLMSVEDAEVGELDRIEAYGFGIPIFILVERGRYVPDELIGRCMGVVNDDPVEEAYFVRQLVDAATSYGKRFCRRSFAVFAATSAQPTSSSTARGTKAARSSAVIRPGVNSPTFSVKPSSVPICAMRTWTWGTC